LPYPESGTSDFESVARESLQNNTDNNSSVDAEVTGGRQGESNLSDRFDATADGDHTHGAGGTVQSIVSNYAALGTGVTIGETKVTQDTGNEYIWTGSVWSEHSNIKGVTATTSAVDITLTSASDPVQWVSMTIAGKYVILPDATTLTEGYGNFIVINQWYYDPFGIKDDDGNILTDNIYAYDEFVCSLIDNSTSAGEWNITKAETQSKTIDAFGTADVFESASTSYISLTTLSSTKAIVAYSDGNNSNYGTACILDVSGSTITAGTPAVFESASTYYTSVARLSPTQAIVTYRDAGNADKGTACILDISGSTITAGTPNVFETGTTSYTSVTALSPTQAIVAYKDVNNSDYGTACFLNILGSTITSNEPFAFETGTTIYTSVATLTNAKAIVAYQDASNSNYGTAIVLS